MYLDLMTCRKQVTTHGTPHDTDSDPAYFAHRFLGYDEMSTFGTFGGWNILKAKQVVTAFHLVGDGFIGDTVAILPKKPLSRLFFWTCHRLKSNPPAMPNLVANVVPPSRQAQHLPGHKLY